MKKNTIYNLDAISKYSIYSKFNIGYEKLLGDRSLKGFVKMNKRPKIIKKSGYLDEIQQKFPKEIRNKEYKDPHEFINQIIMQKKENNKSDKKLNNNYFKVFKSLPNEKRNLNNYYNLKKKKVDEVVALDPFKYNPNYNAIYKKVPYVRIVKPSEIEQKESNNSSSRKKSRNISEKNSANISTNKGKNIEEKEKEKEKENESYNNLSDNKKSKNTSIINNRYNTEQIKLPLVNINRMNDRNENHALRFSKYGNQRVYKADNKNEFDDYLSQRYYKSNNNSQEKKNMRKIISVNFDKMSSRKDSDFVNYQSLDVPSFNRYTPNYDFVKNSAAKISFSYHNLGNNEMKKKKFLLRKLLSSYNVDTDFHIVNTDIIKQTISTNSIDK
jgi:hypothetical protein